MDRRYLLASEAPILTPYLPLEFQDPEIFSDRWLWMATTLRDGMEDGCYEVAFRYGGMLTEALVPPERIRFDAQRLEVMHRIVDWARPGLKCAGGCDCPGREPLTAIGQCPVNGDGCDGYERLPHDLSPFLPTALGGPIERPEDSAALLVWSAREIAKGREPIAGVLPEWATHDNEVYRLANEYEWKCRVGADGWAVAVSFDEQVSGPETGEEGKACADRAVAALRFARFDGGLLILPEVTA